MNAANLFDRNPLHVAHLQGPVDRLHDTNLRAIYERAGKILLIQRWKDLTTAAPHAFLLFESEQAANSCCNRIGAPRITTPNNSHPQSITAAILQPNQPNHPALQQWLSSQNMAPSYVIKNPPTPPKAAGFPLSCLRVLGEDSTDVVNKLREFKCGPGWWRFVAQMYVANKLWAAARMVLKWEKEPDDDIIDISDDSAHEHGSDDDQPGQKSTKPSAAKSAHNVWLPSKRGVSGARAKLGVVTAKPGAVATKPAKGKSTSGPEAPPFVPTPMSESPPADAAPQTSSYAPPTVPATLPMSTRSGTTLSTTGASGSKTIGPPQREVIKSKTEPNSSSQLLTQPQAQPSAKPPPPSQTPSKPSPAPQPANPIPTRSSSRPIVPISITPSSTLDKPTPIISKSGDTGPNAGTSTEITAGSSKADPPKAVGSHDASKSATPPSNAVPTAPGTKSTTPPTGPRADTPTGPRADALTSSRMPVGPKSATPPTGPRSTTPRVSTPPIGPKAFMTLAGQKAPPTGPRALVQAFGTGPANTSPPTLAAPSSRATPTLAVTPAPSTPAPSDNATASNSRTTPQTVDRSKQTQPSQGEATTQVKKETEPMALEDRPSQASRDSSIVPLSRGASTIPPQNSTQEAPATTPPAIQKAPTPVTQGSSQPPSTLASQKPSPPPAAQNTPPKPVTQPEQPVVPMEEDSFAAPTEGDSSFGVASEDLFSLSMAPTEGASSIIPSQDIPPQTSTTKDSTTKDPSIASTLTQLASARTPIRSPSREPLSFFGISSSPSSLPVALPSTSSSPTKRKSDMLETRMIKRRRQRTSSSKSEPIIVEPEISALEAEKARAAEQQAEEDRVRELLGVDMSDYAESVMARLAGSDKSSSRGIVSSSDKSKSPPAQGTPAESDLELELRSLRAMRDENEALKMKIKVLELTLPTAESVKNELYAERKQKGQLIEALEIEKSLLTQSEALRRQSDATREGLQQRIKQLEERLSESAGALEKARDLAQVASEQRRRAEEASAAADAERARLGRLLDAERDLVSQERTALGEERRIKAEAQAKLTATEARLASEQRRYAEERDQAEKERAEAKSFLDAEKAIVSAQEAKLEREKEVRGQLEAKLREAEEKLKEEQQKRIEDKRSADSFLQNELTLAMKLATAERAKTVAESDARGLAEKELVLLREELATSEKKLKDALDSNTSMKRDLSTFKDQLNESERRETMLRAQLSTAGSKLALTEGRARATEDRYVEVEQITRRHAAELSKLQAELAAEKGVLATERQELVKVRIARKELETKLAAAEDKAATSTKRAGELQAQLQGVMSTGQGTREQLQTQRTLLHIARTRIQELEQAIQRVEADLDAARTAEATAKTMVQLWGPTPRVQLSSPVSDIVDQQREQSDTETDPFIPLMKPPRQQSFKLKRTVAPARLLQVDMPSGEPASIDLGGLPANPDTIIELLYKSKCAGVFWDIIMDEYGAMGCFDAAEAIAEGKLKYQP